MTEGEFVFEIKNFKQGWRLKSQVMRTLKSNKTHKIERFDKFLKKQQKWK